MLSSLLRRLHPIQMVLLAFTFAASIGVGLLALPISARSGVARSLMDSVFTATSAICVTGLVTVDTQAYWSPFGHIIILILIQLGGLGVMTLATVIGLGVLGKISLRARITAATEVKSDALSNVKQLVGSIFKITFVIELIVAVVLALRFYFAYGYSFGTAIWHGIFHAISAFNNAGFALYADSMAGFVGDPWICLPVSVAIILGGLGFPVFMQLKVYLFDLLRWSMNTRIVLLLTPFLLLAGSIYITTLEWNNPATLGPLDWPTKLLAGFFQSVQTRTAGFNSIDLSAMYPGTWIGMDILMFIGAGPGGTAGGIKITTFAVLFFVTWTEIRGEAAVNIFGKRLARSVHREAIAMVLLALSVVLFCTTCIVLRTNYGLDPVLFETVSAFATVGLSTGITASLDVVSKLLLCFLMFIGRLGPITFASALALRQRKRLYELPKERPIIG